MVRQIVQLAFYPHCQFSPDVDHHWEVKMCITYLGMQNYTEYGSFCMQIAKPIHLDLWQ